MSTDSRLDVNDLLRIGILIILLLLIFLKIDVESSYLNNNTIYLGEVLAIENLFFLYFEKRNRNPFVILLVFQNFFFFLLRILTLNYTNYSTSLQLNNCVAYDVNYSLFFAIFANIALFIGVLYNTRQNNNKPRQISIPRKKYLVFIPLAVCFFMTYYSTKGIISLINSLFINLSILVMMLIVYIVYNGKNLNKKFKYILFFLIIAYIVMQTGYGSRGAVISVLMFCIFTFLAVHERLKIRFNQLLLVFLITPVMLIFFLFATYMRPQLNDSTNKTLSEVNSIFQGFDLINSVEVDIKIILTPVFDRVGFLDYSAATIKNYDKYAQVFNLPYYFKSIVDNILSPGFDVFDVPRVSNATSFIYYNSGPITKTSVTENYQSDQFCFYGEYYDLFGKWFSLVPIFFTGFLFKWMYQKVNHNKSYFAFIKKAFILSMFYSFLNSFGVDWILLDILGFLFTYFLAKNFFKFSEKSSFSMKSIELQ